MHINDDIPSPCFVLEQDKLAKNLAVIDRIQKSCDVSFILAFKAFALWDVFPLIKQSIDGATASSLNEAILCNEKLGTKAHTYAVAYSSKEFDHYCELSSHLTFNSLSQFHLFKKRLKKYPDLSIGLRVNPLYSDVETDIYNPTSPASRLGIHPKLLPEKLPDEIKGLHFHALCESSATSTEKLLQAIEVHCKRFFDQINWINIGGGHLVTKTGYDESRLIQGINEFKKKYDLDIIMEPGSAFAWETGYLKTTVLDIVENDQVNTAIIDASFTCHMPDCLEMPYQPIVELLGEGSNGSNEHHYNIGGVSCLAGDFITGFSFPRSLEVGDVLVFHDMMHYTMVKTNFFNGVKHPGIGSIDFDGKFKLIRDFKYEDYRNHLS